MAHWARRTRRRQLNWWQLSTGITKPHSENARERLHRCIDTAFANLGGKVHRRLITNPRWTDELSRQPSQTWPAKSGSMSAGSVKQAVKFDFMIKMQTARAFGIDAAHAASHCPTRWSNGVACDGRFWPILLQKSFCTADQKFSGL
jgi:hypothetical protein